MYSFECLFYLSMHEFSFLNLQLFIWILKMWFGVLFKVSIDLFSCFCGIMLFRIDNLLAICFPISYLFTEEVWKFICLAFALRWKFTSAHSLFGLSLLKCLCSSIFCRHWVNGVRWLNFLCNEVNGIGWSEFFLNSNSIL
jgi:hypothetical protein